MPSLQGDGARDGRLAAIPGMPPSLVDPPAGCRFAARCAYADGSDGCAEGTHELRELRPGHRVRRAHPVSALAGVAS